MGVHLEPQSPQNILVENGELLLKLNLKWRFQVETDEARLINLLRSILTYPLCHD